MSTSNFSYHIFLLPFNWGKKGDDNIDSHFSQLVNLGDADTLIQQDDRWELNLYSGFSEPEDYNEYVYFYPTVRDVLYDSKESIEANRVIRHYQFAPAKGDDLKYLIHVETDKINKVYELEIEYILLNLYKTGIGLLSYHLRNNHVQQQEWSDILAINDFGRRIYPPYFDHSGKNGFSTKVPKGTSLASSIRIAGKDSNMFADIIEDFETITGLSVNYNTTIPSELQLLPNHIRQILPKAFCEQFNIRPTLDDRMFVVSSVCDNEYKYSSKIKSIGNKEVTGNFSTEFYQFIFIDGPGSIGVANKEYEEELLKRHLYTRWKDFGTLYGLSRYSLVSYTTWDKILVDTKTIYYKMAELCLLQRSSVIKFSEEVRRIASINENESRLSAYINDLYKNYIIFINRIYFRDITPQEQGIELYDMLREKMRIEKEVTDLDREINELHSYAILQEEKSNNNRLQYLTILGGLFIVPSFFMSFFGMNDFRIQNRSAAIALLFILVLSSLVVSLTIIKGKAAAGKRYMYLNISPKKWLIIVAGIIAIFVLLILLLNKNDS